MATTFAEAIVCPGLTVNGPLAYSSISAGTIARASLVQDDFAVYPVDFHSLRIWDAYQTQLTTPSGDDLGLTAGAFGTGCPYAYAGDVKATSGTRYARFQRTLGPEYVTGESVRVAIVAGMLTTVADTSCTVDLECYLEAGDTLKSGSDLVTTSATSINSLTFATKNFDLNPATLSAGSKLDFRLAIIYVDSATGSAVTPAIPKITFNVDIKG